MHALRFAAVYRHSCGGRQCSDILSPLELTRRLFEDIVAAVDAHDAVFQQNFPLVPHARYLLIAALKQDTGTLIPIISTLTPILSTLMPLVQTAVTGMPTQRRLNNPIACAERAPAVRMRCSNALSY